jgi:hypothetical protein
MSFPVTLVKIVEWEFYESVPALYNPDKNSSRLAGNYCFYLG